MKKPTCTLGEHQQQQQRSNPAKLFTFFPDFLWPHDASPLQRRVKTDHKTLRVRKQIPRDSTVRSRPPENEYIKGAPMVTPPIHTLHMKPLAFSKNAGWEPRKGGCSLGPGDPVIKQWSWGADMMHTHHHGLGGECEDRLDPT